MERWGCQQVLAVALMLAEERCGDVDEMKVEKVKVRVRVKVEVEVKIAACESTSISISISISIGIATGQAPRASFNQISVAERTEGWPGDWQLRHRAEK